MGAAFFAVNEFVVISALILSPILACAKPRNDAPTGDLRSAQNSPVFSSENGREAASEAGFARLPPAPEPRPQRRIRESLTVCVHVALFRRKQRPQAVMEIW